MARILISFFCVFILNSNRTRADVTIAPSRTPSTPPTLVTTPAPQWETKNLGGLMFSVMPNAVISFRSVVLSNVTGITLCLRAVTEKLWMKEDQLQITFSKEPAIYFSAPYTTYNAYQLQVAYSYTTFKMMSMVSVQEVRSLWKSRCLTWDSSSGLAQLWFDGMMSVRKGLSRGTVFSGQAELSLFQFEGQLSDVYMWDSVLSVRELHRYLYHHSVPSRGSVLAWTQIQFKSSGYVVLEPAYPKRLPAAPAKRNKQKRMKGLKKRQRQKFNPAAAMSRGF